ncbi:MAG: MBL fold metallo-hydrolase [Clostridia bacterium]|nr:MBL fold metallo-hydrolase [Clostridia bacterium]
MFEKITDNIYRLRVPFEDLYTSVFLVRTNSGWLLIDSGDGEKDVNNLILPALTKIGAVPECLAVTHSHGDHAGGLPFLAKTFENAKICAFSPKVSEKYSERGNTLCDGDMLLDCIKVIHLPGHSSDSIGFLDMQSNILIGGDAVQLYGITRYGMGLGSPSGYRKTIGRLKEMKLSAYIASHDFYPLGFFASGKDVEKYFNVAIDSLDTLTSFAIGNEDLGCDRIAEEFTKINKKANDKFPQIPRGTVKVILEENKKGSRE